MPGPAGGPGAALTMMAKNDEGNMPAGAAAEDGQSNGDFSRLLEAVELWLKRADNYISQ